MFILDLFTPTLQVFPVEPPIEGESLSFDCSTNSSDPFQYIWYKDEELYHYSQKVLVLLNSARKNAGVYRCSVKTSFLTRNSSSILLAVYCKYF